MKRSSHSRLGRRSLAAAFAAGSVLSACTNNSPGNAGEPMPVSIPLPTASVPAVVAESSVASFLPAAVRSRGLLRIDVVVGRAPDAFVHSGQLVGSDVDLVRSVAGVLGMKVRFSQVDSAAAASDLRAGKADLAFGLGSSSLGRGVVGVPYMRTGVQVVGVPKSGTIYGPTTPVCAVTVVEIRGAAANAALVAQNASCTGTHVPTVVEASDLEHALGLIAAHRASVAWLDASAANYVVAQLSGSYTLASQLLSPSSQLVVVTSLGSADAGIRLGNAVGSALNTLITSGAYVTILQKWGIQGSALTSRDIAVVS